MTPNDRVGAEVNAGTVYLKVCLEEAEFVAKFRKSQNELEATLIERRKRQQVERLYGMKTDIYSYRREIYKNVIEMLKTRIRLLDEEQAASTRARGSRETGMQE